MLTASSEQLMSCMYYPGAGRKTLMKLINKFSFSQLNELMQLDKRTSDEPVMEGIGSVTWNKILEKWNDNFYLVMTMITDYRYDFIGYEEEKETSSSLEGKSFCFTGKISKPRKEYEQMVKDNGGSIKGVSKNLNFLVAGEKAGGKLAKAEKAGVIIITEDEFLNMI